MDKIKCCICNEEFEDRKFLHFHLRSHKISQEEYYYQYYPKRDFLTGELIPFKTAEQYFQQDFVEQQNLYNWLKTQPLTEVRKYLQKILLQKQTEKNLQYGPGQVELRSWNLPSVMALNRVVGDYFHFCEEIGFTRRFSSEHFKVEQIDTKNWTIYIDTREKQPLRFSNIQYEVKGLKFGDYALCNNGVVSNIRIERKSLMDFIGTFSKQVERFQNEVKKAQDNGAYLVVLVEDTLEKALMFNKLSWISQYTRLSPQFVFHNIRRLVQEFENLQFLFVRGRAIAAETLVKLFSIQNINTVDLQYAYDSVQL